jgi:hypothetical protein
MPFIDDGTNKKRLRSQALIPALLPKREKGAKYFPALERARSDQVSVHCVSRKKL